MTGSVRIVPNSAAWRKEGARVPATGETPVVPVVLAYTGLTFSPHWVTVLPTRGERLPYTEQTASLHGAKGSPAVQRAGSRRDRQISARYGIIRLVDYLKVGVRQKKTEQMELDELMQSFAAKLGVAVREV